MPLTDLWPAGRLGPNDLNVRALCPTPQALWVGTDRGLVRVDRRTGARTLSVAALDRPDGLLNDDVRALIADRQGVLWVGTRNGTARADLARGDLTHVAPSPSGLASPMVFAVLEDRRGAVWVGTDDGLFRHDRRAGTFAQIQRAPGSRTGLGAGGVRALLEDADGTLWIGTIGGVLNRLDPATGAVRRYNGDLRDPYDPRFSFRVRALLQDRAGTVWAGAESGLYRIDRGCGHAATRRPVLPGPRGAGKRGVGARPGRARACCGPRPKPGCSATTRAPARPAGTAIPTPTRSRFRMGRSTASTSTRGARCGWG